MTDDQEKLLDGNGAVKYLSEKWGMPYTNGAFRALRFRLAREGKMNIEPALSTPTSNWWKKSDLDKLPKPDRSRPRGPRKNREPAEVFEKDGGDSTSVMLRNIGQRTRRSFSSQLALEAV